MEETGQTAQRGLPYLRESHENPARAGRTNSLRVSVNFDGWQFQYAA